MKQLNMKNSIRIFFADMLYSYLRIIRILDFSPCFRCAKLMTYMIHSNECTCICKTQFLSVYICNYVRLPSNAINRFVIGGSNYEMRKIIYVMKRFIIYPNSIYV